MHQIFSLTKEEYAQNKNNLISQSVTKGETHKNQCFKGLLFVQKNFIVLDHSPHLDLEWIMDMFIYDLG